MKAGIRTAGQFIGLLLLLACSHSPTQNKAASEVAQLDTLAMDTVYGEIIWTPSRQLPEEMDGCGCYFFLTEKDRQDGNYIFADATGRAVVLINGSMLYLDRKEDTGKSGDVMIYSNGQYQLEIEIAERTETESEGYSVKGRMTLSWLKKASEKTFVGYCGC